MSKIICRQCGRDINAIGQDNMSSNENPLCEDCFNEEGLDKYAHNTWLDMRCPNDCSLCGGHCALDDRSDEDE